MRQPTARPCVSAISTDLLFVAGSVPLLSLLMLADHGNKLPGLAAVQVVWWEKVCEVPAKDLSQQYARAYLRMLLDARLSS